MPVPAAVHVNTLLLAGGLSAAVSVALTLVCVGAVWYMRHRWNLRNWGHKISDSTV